ncbi:uncharacterized protein LOC128984235 [Macrosteles quadrilineatus]|uniref:uncharacterized protein LOC128984235 n=1 Tax=Macrosteles quadrilineatus TaxID=74068 RepID=UPI0023E21774|nr:uncharacterized protein LOC128984235 [Macrosteles quadrilineatus]
MVTLIFIRMNYPFYHFRTLANQPNQLGVEILAGFQEVHSLPSRFSKDIILFSPCSPEENQLFAAAIETKPEETLQDTELVLYKYQGDDWAESHRVKAAGGQNIAVEHIQDSVYLVVAQKLADPDLGSTVWRLVPGSDKLQFTHMLNTRLASHAIMWTDAYTYAAVTISENPAGSPKPYSTLSPVYRWLGSSFDMIDTLPTYNPRAIVQFNIRSSVFIAVANYQNDYGETMIDSEIFRYDLMSGKFHVYQKLPTEAAIDIKSFCYQSNQISENFLIYASAFHTDEKGVRDYNSPSVVYKLSDEEIFVPFQALQVSKVTSWLPVEHVKDGIESLTLVGASEEGIISFQYDGWRFVPTGLHMDTTTFSPGPKALNVFYYNDKPFISVANRYSSGYEMNVFSPFFEHHPGVENLQRTISDWVLDMTNDMIEGEAKINGLTRIAQEAPSVGDSVIKLGSHAVFRNAEIHRLETIMTKVGDSSTDDEVYSQLYTLKSQLDRLKSTLEGLPVRIDQTSYHTNTVYEDTFEESAEITCTHSCHAHDLEVINVNSENLSEFLANTVNIKEDVEFSGDVSFKELALIEPLKTKTVNGHSAETLIDWSKEVNLDHKLKVEGDVLAEDSVEVSEAVDGVLINIIKEDIFEPEVIVSPTADLESLNTSQLILSDGKMSEVDFQYFVVSSLKTVGDQSFSVFQDIERITAEEVAASDLFKSVASLPTMSQRSRCTDEKCSDEADEKSPDPELGISQPTSGGRSKKIESINLLDDVIIIPRNLTLYGTVIVGNGHMSATNDFNDLKHNISAEKLLEFGIPLNQFVIDKHFKFTQEPKTPSLNVDTINSVDLESLVNLEEEESVKLTGEKLFLGSLIVDGTLHSSNELKSSELLKSNLKDLAEVNLEYLNVTEIKSNNIRLGINEWQKRVVIRKDGTVVVDNLKVEENLFANNTMVRGKINDHHLENLLDDSVFEGSTLDGLNSRVFGRWLLTDRDQSVIASQAITNLETHNVAMAPGATLNSHNISHIRDAALSRYSGWAQLSCVWQMAVDRRRPECYSLTGHHQPRDPQCSNGTWRNSQLSQYLSHT